MRKPAIACTYHSGMIGLPIASAADPATMFDALAAALESHGACLLQGFADADATAALRADAHRLRDAGALAPAAVGRGASREFAAQVRGDRTRWLDDPRCGDAARAHLHALDVLRMQLNRALFLGLSGVEAHYALYAPGAGYARHRDRFRDSDARVVSLVTYLNPGWSEDDAGALRLHLDGATVDVPPLACTTVCFLSELEHEVLPARRERLSIAAWFRRDR